jgi:Integral membrane protein (intg_mem_TP0381)
MAVTVVSIATLVPLARLRPGRWVTVVSWLLALFLVANEIEYQVYQVGNGSWGAGYSLPLYLCDIGAFVAAAALIWPKPILVEVTWFWAIAGALQGILTPDHAIVFPSYDWLEFYGDHIGVVLAAVFLVVGRRAHPQPRAVLRVIIVSVGGAHGGGHRRRGDRWQLRLSACPVSGQHSEPARSVAVVHPRHDSGGACPVHRAGPSVLARAAACEARGRVARRTRQPRLATTRVRSAASR